MKAIPDPQPPDCYARAKRLEAEVELIRREMGRPADLRRRAAVTGAAPREVYFAALALFRKADRLCHDVTGDALAPVPHAPPATQLKPGHVLGVLDAALAELAEVKSRLGVKENAPEPARDDTKQPSDVFNTIVAAGRQLNLLLEQQFTPSDVHQVIALAVSYTSRLLGRFEDAGTPAEAPAFERYKTPGDVYERLISCVAQLRAITRLSGLTMLDEPPERPEHETAPSDCYDLASLVLAEAAFLHAHAADTTPPYLFEANAPGRRVPSHCHQTAGLLERQLAQLAQLVEKHPHWLAR